MQRAPDRCDISCGTIHPHNECEVARLSPGSHQGLHPREKCSASRGSLRTRIWSQLCLALPPPPSTVSSTMELYQVFPDPALSAYHRLNSPYPPPAPRTLATISPPHKSHSHINCLSINLFQVLAQTVSQGKCLSP